MSYQPLSKSKQIKLIGGSLLLLSFIIQNYIYDDWNSQINRYTAKEQKWISYSQSSIQYLNLYLALAANSDTISNTGAYKDQSTDSTKNGTNNVYNYQKISLVKSGAVQLVHAILNDLFDNINNEGLQSLMYVSLLLDADKVHDLNSYFKFFDKIQADENKYIKLNSEKIQSLLKKKTWSRKIFLAIYIIGSVVLLWSYRFE